MNTRNGYSKTTLDNTRALLAGGGDAPLPIIRLQDDGTTLANKWKATSDLITLPAHRQLFLFTVPSITGQSPYVELSINGGAFYEIVGSNIDKNLCFSNLFNPGSELLLAFNADDGTFDIINFDASSLPLASRTYTGIYATADSTNERYVMFGEIKPDTYAKLWRIRYELKVSVPGQTAYCSHHLVEIAGYSNTIASYRVYNELATYPIYYHSIYRLKSASASTVPYGHLFGIYLNGNNYNSSSYPRTIEITLYEAWNCNVDLFNSAQKYGALNTSTNAIYRQMSHFEGPTNLNATSNGLQETGDANDTGYYILTNGFRCKLGPLRINTYALLLRTGNDGTYDIYEGLLSGLTAASTATTKARNTVGFLPEGKIYWYSGSSTAGAAVFRSNLYQQYHSIDGRYNFNISTTQWKANTPIYLVFTYSDGKLYLDTNWLATALPTTDDGKIYQLVGYSYENKDYYTHSLLLNNPYFKFMDGSVKVWTPESDRQIDDMLNPIYSDGLQLTDYDSSGVINWDNDIYVPEATSSQLGVVKLGSDVVQTATMAAIGTTASKTYAILVNSSGQLVVNVPWSNSTYSAMVEGYCNTAAGTVAKVGTSTNFGNLTTGTTLKIRFTNTNTAANPTLNVNSTGAKPIRVNGDAVSSTNTLPAGTYQCYYDGTNWDVRVNMQYRFSSIYLNSAGYSWLDGLKNAAIKLSPAANTSNYFPWIQLENTASKVWISAGTLASSFYIVGSATTRTANGTDHRLQFDVSTGNLTVSGSMISKGFYRDGSSNSYVLLGAGSHKALTDFVRIFANPSSLDLNYTDAAKDSGMYCLNKNTFTTTNFIPRRDYGGVFFLNNLTAHMQLATTNISGELWTRARWWSNNSDTVAGSWSPWQIVSHSGKPSIIACALFRRSSNTASAWSSYTKYTILPEIDIALSNTTSNEVPITMTNNTGKLLNIIAVMGNVESLWNGSTIRNVYYLEGNAAPWSLMISLGVRTTLVGTTTSYMEIARASAMGIQRGFANTYSLLGFDSTCNPIRGFQVVVIGYFD